MMLAVLLVSVVAAIGLASYATRCRHTDTVLECRQGELYTRCLSCARRSPGIRFGGTGAAR